MSLTNLKKCASAHSTSKIHSSKELNYITSLGFRGEALHSLAQLAELEILSRSATDTAGWRILHQPGMPMEEAPTAIAPGTIVTVSNLFWQLGGSSSGLTGDRPAASGCSGINWANCFYVIPHVTWQVWQNERLWFQISPGSVQQILPQILSSVRSSDLHGVEWEAAALDEVAEANANRLGKIELVLGLPDRCHRRRADWVRVAVNGRTVRSPELEQATIAAF